MWITHWKSVHNPFLIHNLILAKSSDKIYYIFKIHKNFQHKINKVWKMIKNVENWRKIKHLSREIVEKVYIFKILH